jgi:hypothetical protein
MLYCKEYQKQTPRAQNKLYLFRGCLCKECWDKVDKKEKIKTVFSFFDID